MRPRNSHVADKLRRYRKKTAWKRCFVASGLSPTLACEAVSGIGLSNNRYYVLSLTARAESFTLWMSRMKIRPCSLPKEQL